MEWHLRSPSLNEDSFPWSNLICNRLAALKMKEALSADHSMSLTAVKNNYTKWLNLFQLIVCRDTMKMKQLGILNIILYALSFESFATSVILYHRLQTITLSLIVILRDTKKLSNCPKFKEILDNKPRILI